MSVRITGILAGGFLVYGLVVLGAFFVAAKSRENFDSPATASRDVYGFREGDFGLLVTASRRTSAEWPANVGMPPARRIDGANDSFVLSWNKSESREFPKPDRWVGALEGNEQVELVAFASWVPRTEDPVDPPADWEVPLTLREPVGALPLSAEELAGLGIPEEFSRLEPPRRYQTPVLRLVFRTTGMAHPRIVSVSAGDARTGARVSYDLGDSNDGSPRRETRDRWVRIDTDLLLWHDTPLTCHVRFLTGTPEYADLTQTPGAQAAFGDRLRLQWLARTRPPFSVSFSPGRFEPPTSLPAAERRAVWERFLSERSASASMALVELEKGKSGPTTILARASSGDLVEDHCGLVTGGGVLWTWSEEETENSIAIAALPLPEVTEEPLRLVFIPHIAELTFSLPSLPDMPNPRDTADLFDCILPRISLPEDLDEAEKHLLGFIGVGAQVAWESNHLWDEVPPSNLPPDRTFRNATPQGLLDWYLDNTPGAWARFDRDGLILHFNEEGPGWWERAVEKFSNLVPFP